MARLVYIEASPRKERSISIHCAKIFLEKYQKSHPKDEVYRIDLWEKDLPSFDGDVIEAKYAILHGKEASPTQKRAWKRVEELIAEFKTGDKYVISTPMWNYGLPYRLKHYFDILIQPTYTFSFSPQTGFQGLVTGRPVVGIYARGGEYAEGAQEDFQRTYLEYILAYIGFTEIHAVVAQPTLERKEEAIAKAHKQIDQVIAQF